MVAMRAWFLLFGLASGVASGGEPALDGECSRGGSCDEVAMLQRQEKGRIAAVAQPEARMTRKRAVALRGGGFLSLTDFTGVVEGLLSALKQGGREGTLAELFGGVDIVSGVSGGGWTQTLLMYSQSYASMVEASGEDVNVADAMFKETLGKMFSLAHGDDSLTAGLAKCLVEMWPLLQDRLAASAAATAAPSTDAAPAMVQRSVASSTNTTSTTDVAFDAQMFSELVILTASGSVSWASAIEQMLVRAGGLSSDVTLGTANVNEWAMGKTAIWGATAVLPQEEPYEGLTQISVVEDDHGSIAYRRGSGQLQSMMAPARFSIVVGGGEAQDSPLDFCPGCAGYTVQYTLNNETVGEESSPAATYRTAFEQGAGQLPLDRVSAVTSAFEGKKGIEAKVGASQGCAALAVWATGEGSGKSFKAADELRSKVFHGLHQSPAEEVAKSVAAARLQPLIDGGFSELTGTAHALAAGADEVVVFLDVDVNGEPNFIDPGFLTLFAGFTDGEDRTVFQSPDSDVAKTQLDAATRIPAVEGAQFLQDVAFATIEAVTADAPQFGVSAGRPVTVHVIAINTQQITIGLVQQGYSYDSFMDYGTLIGEIARTLAGSQLSQQMLPFFGA